jgi:hypothetical protein
MITWELGHITAGDPTENGFSWIPPESTVAMVIVGTASPEAERGECTTLTLAPKIQMDGAKTIHRKCLPGTVVLLRGRSSWTKWKYTFDGSRCPYYRVCFFHVDPLAFPVHNKPYQGVLVSQPIVIPALGVQEEKAPPLPQTKQAEEEEKKNSVSKPRLPSTFKKRKTDKK